MISYGFQCPICGDTDTISKADFEYWGEPFCEGQLDDEHETVTMKRHYTAPTVVWPKANRGH